MQMVGLAALLLLVPLGAAVDFFVWQNQFDGDLNQACPGRMYRIKSEYSGDANVRKRVFTQITLRQNLYVMPGMDWTVF